MQFDEFKNSFLKVPVEEYPNNRQGKKPLVTVKLVTYNHVNFIEECIDSILNQKTSFDYEILIAEDDSNDGTREICKEYAAKYPDKIRLLLNSRQNNILINGKPSGTFNSLYANYSIESKYISMVEGDDYWTDEYSLEKRVAFLEENLDYIACFHNAIVYYQNKEKFGSRMLRGYNENISIEKNSFIDHAAPTASIMFRHGIIDVFHPGMLGMVSGDVILRTKLSHFGRAMYLNNIGNSVYRMHSGGAFSGEQMSNQWENSIKVREYLLEYFKEKKWNVKPINGSLANMYFDFFIQALVLRKRLNINFLTKSYSYLKVSDESIFGVVLKFLRQRVKK